MNALKRKEAHFANLSIWDEDTSEFQNILDKLLTEEHEAVLTPPEVADEFRILLPKHSHYWDNGYEDIEFG